MVTSGVELFRRVKVMEQDLFSFILISVGTDECEAVIFHISQQPVSSSSLLSTVLTHVLFPESVS
jgi:hypothetical protein